MILRDILSEVSLLHDDFDDSIPVTGVAYDSRKIRSGMLFVCIEGFVTDGHLFAAQAAELGACAVVVQKPIDHLDIPVLQVKDTRIALARISRNLYHDPCGRLPLAGVTGTAGKTSISYMLHAILEEAGHPAGLIGPVANIIGGTPSFSLRSTPESVDLMAILDEMESTGSQDVVMEVSSQGLRLGRVAGCSFETGVFSNLFSNYIRIADPPAPEKALDTKRDFTHQCKHVVINKDAPYADQFIASLDRAVITYGTDPAAAVRASNMCVVKHGSRFGTRFHLTTPWFSGAVFIGLPCGYHVSNALGAIAAAALRGAGLEDVRVALAEIVIPGCVQPVGDPDRRVYVDSAKTPDELEKLLQALRADTSGRLLCLFGCDGKTSAAVRAATGAIVARLSDVSVIAPDNPYFEEPGRIATDILRGYTMGQDRPFIYNSREEAIRGILEKAGPDDVIVLTGKGHRAYQMFGTRTIPQSDADCVVAILRSTDA